MTERASGPEWLRRRERGSPALLRFIVWLALTLGRSTTRILLYPICLYFLLFSPRARGASKTFLTRALGRPPKFSELYKHHFYLGACLLDRLFFLSGNYAKFDIRIHGEDIALKAAAAGKGCILLGAHFGSFEAARALARTQPDLRIALLMYEENARNIGAMAAAINPSRAAEVIALGKPDSMLKLMDRLESGAFIGILADRTIEEGGIVRCPFLGAPAPFPLGPFRLARVLRRPLILMLGVYGGGARYDIHFELLGDWTEPPGRNDVLAVERMLRHYVGRLEDHVRRAPYNWFNFYDIWR